MRPASPPSDPRLTTRSRSRRQPDCSVLRCQRPRSRKTARPPPTRGASSRCRRHRHRPRPRQQALPAQQPLLRTTRRRATAEAARSARRCASCQTSPTSAQQRRRRHWPTRPMASPVAMAAAQTQSARPEAMKWMPALRSSTAQLRTPRTRPTAAVTGRSLPRCRRIPRVRTSSLHQPLPLLASKRLWHTGSRQVPLATMVSPLSCTRRTEQPSRSAWVPVSRARIRRRPSVRSPLPRRATPSRRCTAHPWPT
mmetsp:Transcript_17780/g.45987  ORF Transcript_17780/g.45987 Transcript_17780/m.45987 type:complete len:253 (-) Transcript_17780:330-1088(-)